MSRRADAQEACRVALVKARYVVVLLFERDKFETADERAEMLENIYALNDDRLDDRPDNYDSRMAACLASSLALAARLEELLRKRA
jgi:hypothetical protein